MNSTDIMDLIIQLPTVDIDSGDVYSIFIEVDLVNNERKHFILNYDGRASSIKKTEEALLLYTDTKEIFSMKDKELFFITLTSLHQFSSSKYLVL